MILQIKTQLGLAALLAIFLSIPAERKVCAQEPELFNALVDLSCWMDELTSFKLEVKSQATKSVETKAVPGISPIEHAYFENSGTRIFAAIGPGGEKISLVACRGGTFIKTNKSPNNPKDNLEDGNDTSDTAVVMKLNGVLKRFDEHKRPYKNSVRGVNDINAGFILLGREYSIELIPTLLLDEKDDDSTLDGLSDFLVDSKGKSDVLELIKESSKDGRELHVFRVSGIGTSGVAVKAVVSGSGLDQGKVLELHVGLLRQGERKNKYVSDDQLDSVLNKSITILWKEICLGARETMVLPVEVRKSATYRMSGQTVRSEIFQFQWAGIESVEESVFTFDSAFEKAKELRKEIDVSLNR